jgi:hypothetical protein
MDKRISLYNICHKALFKKFNKKKLIGSGEQGGAVFKYCINDKDICIAGKKSYINNKESIYIEDIFNINALKYSVFIEYAAMQLTNTLILQNISPHYALNYQIITKDRSIGPCITEYPYKVTFLNELIDGITYDTWTQQSHSKEELMNAYFQIIVAIYALQKFFNMTHLDLHAENILVKKVKKGGYWKYKIGDTEYFVPNLGYIFYIIDFGHAWIPGKFKSWFIRQRKNAKLIHKSYDLMTLFRVTLKNSKSLETKAIIRTIIKKIRIGENYENLIKKYWKEYTLVVQTKIIDVYDFNKTINTKYLQKQLRDLV